MQMMILSFVDDVGALKRLVFTLLQLRPPVVRVQQEQTLVADGLYHGSKNLPSITANINRVRRQVGERKPGEL